MLEQAQLVSKVLVLESDPQHLEPLKAFCALHRLVPIRTQEQNVAAVLKANVDLGAILLAEDFGGTAEAGLAHAREIHRLRPELPIFLRRKSGVGLDHLGDEDRALFCLGYSLRDLASLGTVVEAVIFNLVYPSALVRGLADITQAPLKSQFKGLRVEGEAPYLVRDRIIYGELFSLIPLESHWCRGYLMLQAEEEGLLDLVRGGNTLLRPDQADFRDLNGLLGEITNLVWGSFKSRYVLDQPFRGHLAQVPIIVNHRQKYISFGSEDPQLCFKYILTPPAGKPVTLYFRIVFNLAWAPDDFKDVDASFEQLVDSGELELF